MMFCEMAAEETLWEGMPQKWRQPFSSQPSVILLPSSPEGPQQCTEQCARGLAGDIQSSLGTGVLPAVWHKHSRKSKSSQVKNSSRKKEKAPALQKPLDVLRWKGGHVATSSSPELFLVPKSCISGGGSSTSPILGHRQSCRLLPPPLSPRLSAGDPPSLTPRLCAGVRGLTSVGLAIWSSLRASPCLIYS